MRCSMTLPLVALNAMLCTFLRTLLLLPLSTLITSIIIIQFPCDNCLFIGYRPQLHASTEFIAANDCAQYIRVPLRTSQSALKTTRQEFYNKQSTNSIQNHFLWLKLNCLHYNFHESNMQTTTVPCFPEFAKTMNANNSTQELCRIPSSLYKGKTNNKS